MRVIALDTTTRRGSVALVVDDCVVEERAGDASCPHAERLPGDILDVTRAHGLSLRDVDLFAVASGPGSFTGLRIGIATIQGLAVAAGRRIVAVSALEALAQIAGADSPAGTRVAAWTDAHRQDVFAALYRVTQASPFEPERLEELEGPTVGRPEAVLERWRVRFDGGPTLYMGDGANLYSDAIVGATGSTEAILPLRSLAGAIGRLAVGRARRDQTIDPAGVQPLYVRRPDAEVDREKQGRH